MASTIECLAKQQNTTSNSDILTDDLDSRIDEEDKITTQVRQLFVGNLPFRIRWQDLKDYFRKAGQVIRADVALSFDNRSKGHGTVLFATVEDAQAAIDMLHNSKWHGRTLEVREDRGYIEQPLMRKSNLQQDHQIHNNNNNITKQEYIQPGRQLFVGNLPFHCQWQDVKDLFRAAGKILRADVAQEQDGKSRGFGTVLFATFEDAKKAIEMYNGFEYQGRHLRVHFDKFASNNHHHHHHQYNKQKEYLSEQVPSRFGNTEFNQQPDPAVLESLKQTYGNNNPGGYATFSMEQSPYLSTYPTEDNKSKSTMGYTDSSGLSSLQQQPYYPHDFTSKYYSSSMGSKQSIYDQDIQLNSTGFIEKDTKQQSSSLFMQQSPSFISPYQWTSPKQETSSPYQHYQQPYYDIYTQQQQLTDDMKRMGLSNNNNNNSTAGLTNLGDSRNDFGLYENKDDRDNGWDTLNGLKI